jgi:peptide deformylase
MATILTIPHPTLRQVAQPVDINDPRTPALLELLANTLRKTKNPRGIGLAAPQINQSWRVFATQLVGGLPRSHAEHLELYINPVIVQHSATKTLRTSAEKADESFLEGCLSIPNIYGAVQRYTWIELQYDAWDGQHFMHKTTRLDDLAARVVQHELDHLDGILFIDHSVRDGLPVYFGEGRGDDLERLSDDLVQSLLHSSLDVNATSRAQQS